MIRLKLQVTLVTYVPSLNINVTGIMTTAVYPQVAMCQRVSLPLTSIVFTQTI